MGEAGCTAGMRGLHSIKSALQILTPLSQVREQMTIA